LNRLNIKDIDKESFSVTITDTDVGVCLKFTGDIDIEDPRPLLYSLLDELYTGIIVKELKELVYDFHELTYINSTSIGIFAKWILKLSSIEEDKRFLLRIITNKNITWQETSLPTLSYLIPGIVTIQ